MSKYCTYPCIKLVCIFKFDHLNLFKYVFFEINIAVIDVIFKFIEA